MLEAKEFDSVGATRLVVWERKVATENKQELYRVASTTNPRNLLRSYSTQLRALQNRGLDQTSEIYASVDSDKNPNPKKKNNPIDDFKS